MLTRCPACSTTFRVQPEQLKARQGKVRCGECQQVFSALDSLIEEFVLTPPLSASKPESADRMEDAATGYAPAGADAVPPGLTFDPAEPEPAVAAEPAPATNDIAEEVTKATPAPFDRPAPDVIADDVTPDPLMTVEARDRALPPDPEIPAPTVPDLSTPVAGLPAAEAPAENVSAPVTAASPAAPEPVANVVADEFEPALHTPSASRPAGLGTWAWAGGIIVAIVALIIQGLMLFRVEIATVAPQTRHIFVTACELIGCTVDLPKKIELLSIESSDLHPDPAFPDQAGHLGVQLSLRNRAPFAQTWPHLELTLTDTSETVIVRRVFTARDYLIARTPTEAMLSQGIGPREDVALELALDVGELVASGYRLYLFYP